MGEPTVTLTTVSSEEVATELARRLVELHIVACCNIVPSVKSIYDWKDKVQIDSEVLMIIKSTSNNTEKLINFIEQNHIYQVPEIITMRVETASKPYLNYLIESTSKSTPTTEETSK